MQGLTRSVKWLATLMAVAMLTGACGSDATDTPEAAPATTEAAAPAGGTFGLTYTQAAPFYTALIKGAEDAGAPLGFTINAVNLSNDPALELATIQNFVTQEVDGIILDALGSTTVDAVKLAIEAGIPVVCANLCLADEDMREYTVGYVTSDNSALGQLLGIEVQSYIDANLDGTAEVIMLGCSRFEVCQLRDAAFKAELGPNVVVVAQQDTLEPTEGPQIAQDLLTANPDVTVIAGMFVFGAEAGLAGVRASGLAGEVVVFGTDLTPPLAEALLDPDGIMQGMIDQDSATQGAVAVQMLLDVIAGELYMTNPYDQRTSALIYSRDEPTAIEEYLAAN